MADYLEFKSDMNPYVVLRIFKQMDSDIVLALYDNETEYPSIEFEACTPMMGGGKHEALWKALVDFYNVQINNPSGE